MAVDIDFHIKRMDDEYLVRLRDTNQMVADEHRRNADRMQEIVDAMTAEIERRGLNAE